MNQRRFGSRTGIATVATAALIVGALQAAPAAATVGGDETSDQVTASAIAGVLAAGAGVPDELAFTETGALIADEAGMVEIAGTSVSTDLLQIGLPTQADLELSDGLAASVDPDTGLGVVVAAVEGGGVRVVTVAEENYGAGTSHEYAYELGLPLGTEARQLSTGEVVLVASSAADSASSAAAEAVDLPADLDAEEYAAGLEEASAGVGPASDSELGDAEVIVGGFMEPWSVDANGAPLETHYELRGDSLVQVVDTAGAAFPVVSDPAPLIVIGLLAAARVFVAASARAFVTVSIRAGMAMTTRGGFSSFARFKAWAGNAKPNHQWHHIVEQGNTKFPAAALHNPQNLVQIPTAIHQRCINSWMARKFAGSVAGFAFNSASTIRSQVRSMNWQSQHRFGVQLLRVCGVNL